ncbi:MAG TPA: ribonuclease G [Gammaproteobacteria bacterium]|nr:ribonuclease G [Gammaproteobacteria bacterium]
MTEEILINVTPRESRVALLENGIVQELWIERARRRGFVGNIYKGKVTRVLPGMQAAFIDIGLERTAFLHASDIVKLAYPENDYVEQQAPDIRSLLHDGKELLVQVLKDPLGSKGARLTTHISIPSRYLVFLPGHNTVALSARIENDAERERLRGIVSEFSIEQRSAEQNGEATGGYIVRTAAEGASRDALRADMLFLNRLWESVQAQSRQAKVGQLVHEDLALPVRILRDMLGSQVQRVWVDSAETYEHMRVFAELFIPEFAPRLEAYSGNRPIFDRYGVDDEIQKALERKVVLKSGGYLIIDQTEAMTTIDVNTGAYLGHRNLEETSLKTNLEAAQAIARQLRLRNLGGIVIIDFIDMGDTLHKQMVHEALQKSMAKDHAKSHICEVSELGLIQMTRKRTRESLEHILCMPCPSCDGRSSLKTPETVCYEIMREIMRETRQFDFQEVLVLAAPAVLETLLDEESATLAELESHIGKPIRLQTEDNYSQEQFDVIPM